MTALQLAPSHPGAGPVPGGHLASNIVAFGRALRRAGLQMDAARMALAQRAAMLVGVHSREDLSAALESVMVSREADRQVFREMFAACFAGPTGEPGFWLLQEPEPDAPGQPPPHRPRVRQALGAGQAVPVRTAATRSESTDTAMSASELQRLRRADFNQLDAGEFQRVQRLAAELALVMPTALERRTRPGARGAVPHWAATIRRSARTGGELMELRHLQRREAPLPLLVLLDVSGSMERYARMLLAFLHAATRELRRRDVFAIGTRLTDLSPAFRLGDTDAMLGSVSGLVSDFAGGTRLADSLAGLRRMHGRRLVGRRTLVLLITDGLDTGEPADLARELHWLNGRSRRLLWLNPLLRFEGYQPLARGASVIDRHAHRTLAVHNIEKLEQLAAGLSALMKR